MNRLRRRARLGAGAMVCAALLAAAPGAQAAPSLTGTVAVGSVTAAGTDSVAVTVDYTCPALGLTDTFRVTVTDTVGGGQFRAVGTAVCDGTPQSVTVAAQRLAGPGTRSGRDTIVTASLGAGVGTFFMASVTASAAKTLV